MTKNGEDRKPDVSLDHPLGIGVVLHTVSRIEEVESWRYYNYRNQEETVKTTDGASWCFNLECSFKLTEHIYAVSIQKMFPVGGKDEDDDFLNLDCNGTGLLFPEKTVSKSMDDFQFSLSSSRFTQKFKEQEDGTVVAKAVIVPQEELCRFCGGKTALTFANCGGAHNEWIVIFYCLDCSRIDKLERHYEGFFRTKTIRPGLMETEGREHMWGIYKFHYDEADKALKPDDVKKMTAKMDETLKEETIARALRKVVVPVEVEA